VSFEWNGAVIGIFWIYDFEFSISITFGYINSYSSEQ